MELTEQTSKITALAIGGPLHGKRLRSLPPTAVTTAPTLKAEWDVADGRGEGERQHVYTLFRYASRWRELTGAPSDRDRVHGWRISLPIWVHTSQVVEGSPMIDQHDLPESWRATSHERCPLKIKDLLG